MITEADIERLFESILSRVKDEDLRAKTVRASVIACHAKEGEGCPQVVETVLIHQADFATFDPLVMMERNTLIQ
jgi:hypothetical protein